MCLGIIIPNVVSSVMTGWCYRIPQPSFYVWLTSQKKLGF